nr:hypothetical protein [Vibrio splendidus]
MGLTLTEAPTGSSNAEKHISANLQAIIDEGKVQERLLQHLTEAFMHKVVSHQGYTNLELQAAFGMIKSSDHWKSSIDTVILAEDFDVCSEACSYITGSILSEVSPVGEDKIRVVADGYFVAIGS